MLKSGYIPSIDISSSEYSYRTVTKDTTVTKYTDGTKKTVNTYSATQNKDYSYFELDFNQTLSGALQYHVIPSKLDFNFGASITLPKLTYKDTKKDTTSPAYTTTKTTATDGTVTEVKTVTDSSSSSSDEQTASWSSASSEVAVGLTWFINENMNIDTSLDIGISGSSSSIFSSSLRVGCLLKF